MQNERKKLEELNLLDVYVESDGSAEIDASEDASIYDLEPDKNDRAKYIAAFPQRIRFYHAIIDSRSLKSGVSAWRCLLYTSDAADE